MPGPDLALLIDAVRSAGKLAFEMQQRGFSVEDKPGGAGPVTDADLAVDALLRRELTDARPGFGWLSEETPDDGSRLTAEYAFIVDPIDGTRAFVDGHKDWAVSAALVRDGAPVAAVVYLPVGERLYSAEAGAGAMLNGEAITVSDTNLQGASLLANRATMEPHHWTRLPPVTRHFRSSLAYRLCLVASGRFDGMATFRDSWHWDIAAGALIVTEAGGRVSDKTGGRLTFNTDAPQSPGTLAANPDVHQGLIDHIKTADSTT